MNVQIMVYVYLAICLSMIIFNLAYVAMYRRGDRVSRRIDNAFSEKIRDEIKRVEQGESVSDKHLSMLCKKCRNIWYFVALDEVLTEYTAKNEDAVNAYVKQIQQLFIYLSMTLHRKDNIQQAHFAYMVERYKVVHGMPISNIVTFMLELVQSSNLYCRQNALRVLYDSGDIASVVKAIQFLSAAQHFHHEKLLTDGLLSFNGDREELIAELLRNRKTFSKSLQLVILNFVRFGSGQHCKDFYDILLDETEEDEARFCALRYFGKYPYAPAEKILKDIALHPDRKRWEYASIAVSSLAIYPGEDTIKILKDSLSHSKWYIRYNAAVSLERLNVTYLDLADIFDGNDRYAREVLQYRMDMNRMRQETRRDHS